MIGHEKYAIGLMSGSSLDGIDLCYVRFVREDQTDDYAYEIVHSKTYPISEVWKGRLAYLHEQSAKIYAKTHVYFGHYLAENVNQFIADYQIENVDFIASHGHTVFHEPIRSYTAQIGDGASLSTLTGYPVVCDFRSSDVAMGGEGAPLAPVVERFLFSDYDLFLNLGGIANLSMIDGESIIAQDVCAANQLLNFIANREGLRFDRNGMLASTGNIIEPLLDQLNDWRYFKDDQWTSIGNAMIRDELLPILNTTDISSNDLLATLVEHIALQIASQIRMYSQNRIHFKDSLSVLCTGGGVFNSFLMKILANYTERIQDIDIQLVVPDKEIIEHKESLLVAFLGLRRWEGKWNSIANVTGAQRNTVNGCIFLP